MAVVVPPAEAEVARAIFVELFPEGFEDRDVAGAVELAAYADPTRELQLRDGFGAVTVTAVEEGWEDRWRGFHHGRRVGELWIGPPWEAGPVDVPHVVIDPGRAFGTGSHATTRLCLELLGGQPRGSLVDIGCGSGVLAIAAARLGFAPVLAIDVDPDAVDAATRNAAENGVSIEIVLADALVGSLPASDLAVGNLTLDAVRAVVQHLRSRRLVSSGYLVGDDLAPARCEHVERREAEGWAADVWALPERY